MMAADANVSLDTISEIVASLRELTSRVEQLVDEARSPTTSELVAAMAAPGPLRDQPAVQALLERRRRPMLELVPEPQQ